MPIQIFCGSFHFPFLLIQHFLRGSRRAKNKPITFALVLALVFVNDLMDRFVVKVKATPRQKKDDGKPKKALKQTTIGALKVLSGSKKQSQNRDG